MLFSGFKKQIYLFASIGLVFMAHGCLKKAVNNEISATSLSPVAIDKVLGGTWAKMAVFTSNSSAMGVSSKSSIARYVLMEIKKQGASLEVQEKTCDITAVSSGSSTISFPEAFINSIEDNTYTYVLSEKNGATALEMVDAVEVLGAKLVNKMKDELPSSAEDSHVVDQDRDQHPGVTVNVSIKMLFSIKAQIYIVQRTLWSEQATVTDENKISGLITWTPEQKTLGATNTLLTSVTPSIKAIAAESPFTLIKMPEGTNCETIRQQRDKLFPPLKI